MFLVTVNTGPSQAFNVNIDRVPVAGDFIQYGGNAYIVQGTWMADGGGTNTFAKIQNASAKTGPAAGTAASKKK